MYTIALVAAVLRVTPMCMALCCAARRAEDLPPEAAICAASAAAARTPSKRPRAPPAMGAVVPIWVAPKPLLGDTGRL